MADARTVVITGGSDGIGAAAARALAAKGWRVVVVGRNAEKTATVAEEIGAERFVADFSRLDEVRELAARLVEQVGPIDVLANNAGGIFGDRTRTVDGHELTLQVNHLAPFLLTNLLLDQVSVGAVVNTASIAARLMGRIDLDDLNNDARFSANKAYGDAKLANILFTKGLHRGLAGRPVASVAFHPGVVGTNFSSDSTSLMRLLYRTPLAKLFTISAAKGGETLEWFIAGQPGVTWQAGEYYDERHHATNVNPQIFDEDLIEGLWKRSAELVGLDAR
ncbi:SDR family NAD(P)-dependent oxidoreductase [Pseudoclavibacter sp. VKM Ac-2888]|uniref:SDR family NAD(P)-dependent oxidoreductase n=1 Tax=Pseudoclavibacter sp. VKM Ac-2888 TaxID=2783830 RepID=UPI00188D0359|nr:SDR family NAD(P)-dependent oxidoreductase [Pseudoclavibacter sp. VKM Ac-2888]MBF4551090.1 SDR family NAD(P)-dependent oxidoreductase [Pseudoclavibacter sp. VKM Ac-2888]